MIRCLICNQSYSRRDALRRHERNVHGSGKNIDQSQPLKEITFQRPFFMMVTGPSVDLMTEAKCDQRIADLSTKGSHHRNISIVYLTQNVFPQGKACRDIALNMRILKSSIQYVRSRASIS